MIKKSTLFLFFLFILPFAAYSQPGFTNLNLKIPDSLYYSRSPANNKSIRFVANTILSAIDVFTSDNARSLKLKQATAQSMGVGRKSFLLAIPLLYTRSLQGTAQTLHFGENGGEDKMDDALVSISYAGNPASTELNSNHPPVLLKLEDAAILNITNASSVIGLTGTKTYLKVDASNSNTATLTLRREARRGGVLVCIFNATNGNLIGLLNPKRNSVESFTTRRDVWVVPIIKPNRSRPSGSAVDEIIFEVGDPVVNGTVRASEE